MKASSRSWSTGLPGVLGEDGVRARFERRLPEGQVPGRLVARRHKALRHLLKELQVVAQALDFAVEGAEGLLILLLFVGGVGGLFDVGKMRLEVEEGKILAALLLLADEAEDLVVVHAETL